MEKIAHAEKTMTHNQFETYLRCRIMSTMWRYERTRAVEDLAIVETCVRKLMTQGRTR